jgi:hypothetical protein
MLLKAQAHPVVGIPQVLTHADTMTHIGNAVWPAQRYHRGLHGYLLRHPRLLVALLAA